MSYDIPENGLIEPAEGRCTCFWPGDKADYLAYHDDEWGHPVADDQRLFEKICLEGFQSGLSWLTILRKRENFRAAFAGFDFQKVAKFDEKDIERLMGDAGIVRHRRKIESTINNARRACDLVDEAGSLAAFFWSYVPPTTDLPVDYTWASLREFTFSVTSKQLSKDLKKRGWSFVGPTTAYAFMQAMGLVNDHVEGCDHREKVAELQASFKRPG